jgi:tetratricopeptide (TPR) repeat protein
MASPDPARYASEQVRYTLLNLHPAAVIERITRLFTGAAPVRLIEVIGAAGSGRQYLIEAAAFESGRKGAPVTVIPLDFDGAEPGAALTSYIALTLAKAEAVRSPSATLLGDLAQQLASLPDPPEADFPGVAGAAIAAALDSPCAHVIEYLRNPRERLAALLEPAAARGPVVLHVKDAILLDRASRRLLLDLAAQHRNLFLSLACETPPPADRNSERVFVQPWNQEELRERVRERFAPSAMPNDFHAALWESGGGAGRLAAADALLRLLARNAIRQDGFGAWSVPRDWRKDSAVSEELARRVDDPVDTALTALTEEQEAQATEFLRLAALCHPAIPVNLLLAAAGIAPDQQSDFLDECVDEPLGTEGPDTLFEDLGYSHPGFPANMLTYRFRDPAMPAAILERVPAAARDALARRLLSYLDRALPPLTKAAARLRLRVLSRLDNERERERAEHLLAWWAGAEHIDALREDLVDGMHDGHFSPDFLWTLFQQTEDRWPAFRRLALLEAYEKQPGGIPSGAMPGYLAHRIPLLIAEGRFAEAAEFSRQGREQGRGLDGAIFQTLEGRALLGAGDYEAARQALDAALAACASYPPNHPFLLGISNDLARCRFLQGAPAEAEEILRRIVPQLREAGMTLPALDAASSLGQVLLAQRRLDEAAPILADACNAQLQLLGPAHPGTIATLEATAGLRRAQGRHAEARNILEQAAAASEQAFGAGHPQTARLIALLDSVPAQEE